MSSKRRYFGFILKKRRLFRIRYIGLYLLALGMGVFFWSTSGTDGYYGDSALVGRYIHQRPALGYTYSAKVVARNKYDILPESSIVVSVRGLAQSPALVIFSAYYDVRASMFGSDVIRIFAVSSDRRQTLRCCVKFVDSTAWVCSSFHVKTKVLSTTYSRGGRDRGSAVYEIMYVCHGVPELRTRRQHQPASVALMENLPGNITISHGRTDIRYPETSHVTPQERFAVCVHRKRVNSSRLYTEAQDLVEFLELTQILGTSHWSMYNSSDVISGLGRTTSGSVTNTDWSTSHGDIAKFPLLSMNDCLYRNIGLVEYVVYLDVNEILVPTTSRDWAAMLDSLQVVHNSSKVGAYMFQVFSFYDETTNGTASYAILNRNGNKRKTPSSGRNHQHTASNMVHLPRTVRFRSRDNQTSDISILAQVSKVDHMTGNANMKMLPGYYYINAPIEYGSVHRFIHEHRRLKGLVVDSTKDSLVPRLLRALHIRGYNVG